MQHTIPSHDENHNHLYESEANKQITCASYGSSMRRCNRNCATICNNTPPSWAQARGDIQRASNELKQKQLKHGRVHDELDKRVCAMTYICKNCAHADAKPH